MGIRWRKVRDAARRYGLKAALRRTLTWALARAGLVEDTEARRRLVARYLSRTCSSTVRYGPLRGMVLPEGAWWSMHDRAAMVLGLYERDVLEELVRALRRRSLFIDIGAGDGYFAVGLLATGHALSCLCFEASMEGRAVIAECARANGVTERIRIDGAADRRTLIDIEDRILADSVVLIDIEGEEFELLDDIALERLREAVVVVELHDHRHDFDTSHRRDLHDRAARHFEISEIPHRGRNPAQFPELDHLPENDRWLACSEGRSAKMTWLLFEPRTVTGHPPPSSDPGHGPSMPFADEVPIRG
ncbi:MAG: FkbM family methyltransferase [Geminicoccaceae bacterium]|nr:FkbM family methyltransferase [Geminicoccaceae bacterium]